MIGIDTRTVQTRYGIRRYHYGRCPHPDCNTQTPNRVKRSHAIDDLRRHITAEHPRKEQ